jgi:hypothetical protein
MNIADTIGFDGVQDLDSKEQVGELVSRLELFRRNLVNQLRAQPSIFFADPDTETEKVAGAKIGDLAVWQDSLGTQHYRILGV